MTELLEYLCTAKPLLPSFKYIFMKKFQHRYHVLDVKSYLWCLIENPDLTPTVHFIKQSPQNLAGTTSAIGGTQEQNLFSPAYHSSGIWVSMVACI